MKDGKEATIVEVLEENKVFIADIGTSIKDWDTIDDIEKIIHYGMQL